MACAERIPPAKESQPTERQRAVLDCIAKSIETTGRPPSYREISASLDFSSPSAARSHIKALEKRGYITVSPGTARGLCLTKSGPPKPAPGQVWTDGNSCRYIVSVVTTVSLESPNLLWVEWRKFRRKPGRSEPETFWDYNWTHWASKARLVPEKDLKTWRSQQQTGNGSA